MTVAVLKAQTHGPAKGSAPEALVVLVHGYGANGRDLIGIGGEWAKAVPGALFLAPDGPEPLRQVPGGRQWFPITGMDPQALVSGVDQARPSLQHFVDSQLSRHELSVERLVLMGFSQGAMLALDLGLRLDPPPAAIMAYSGALLRVPRSPSADRPVPPIMLRHGDADQVVPPDALMTSIAALSSAGASAVWSLEAGLPHGISPGGLAEGARFLRAALAGRLKNWTPSQRANAAS